MKIINDSLVGYKEVLARLDELKALPKGWAGPSSLGTPMTGLPMTADALASAEGIISLILVIQALQLETQPQLVPVQDGGLQMEWHENGWDIEISVEPNGNYGIWARNADLGVTYEIPDFSEAPFGEPRMGRPSV